jgi:hypothetical protein
MAEEFTLSLNYKNQELQLPAELRVYGHTHKIMVNINGAEVVFEPDEERNYRAIVPEANMSKMDVELLTKVAGELEEAFK